MFALCFLLMALVSVAAFLAGNRAARVGVGAARFVSIAGIGLLLAWAWLRHNLEIATRLFPDELLLCVEGTLAVPLFMLVIGVAWAHSHRLRQRVAVGLAVMIGVAHFLHGGIWMLQSTPVAAFGDATKSGMFHQTQDYSCVPAACATALMKLGVSTTEARMAELTHTRPGMGATVLRAIHGMNRELVNTNYEARVVDLPWEELRRHAMPALAVTCFETGRRHMVVVLEIKPQVVLIADPAEGKMWLSRSQFEEVYTGQAIVFVPRDGAERRPVGEPPAAHRVASANAGL